MKKDEVDPVIGRLAKLVSTWGGRISVVPSGIFKRTTVGHADNNPWSEAPFTEGHAVRWDTGAILADRARVSPSALIHEMGHVFADLNTPYNADEFEWFGWEYLLAKQMGITQHWIADNRLYGVDSWNASSFGDLDEVERLELLTERVQVGIANGCITPKLEPVPRRRPARRMRSRM